jgi:hypothetical protein
MLRYAYIADLVILLSQTTRIDTGFVNDGLVLETDFGPIRKTIGNTSVL